MAGGKPGNPNWVKGGPSPNPDGGRKQRRDGWVNSASGHGTERDRRMLTSYGVDVVTDLQAMQLWRSEWLCAKVIETRPREGFRRGYEIDVDDKEIAEEICAAAEDLGVDAAMVRALEYECAYGGAAIFPVLTGALGDLGSPLNDDGIASVRALHVLEPRELYPVSFYEDLENPKFGQPEIYQLMPVSTGRRGTLGWRTIHESRLVIFHGIRVSKQTQPGQRMGWGDSGLSRPYHLIRDLGLSIGSATTILQNYGRDVLQLEGWAELASRNEDAQMAARIRAFEMTNSALRLGVLDINDRITTRGQGTLSGIDDVLETQAHFVAAAVGIPISVLLDMSPGSLNATGDMNIRNWYASVENDQSSNYRPRLERLIRLILLSKEGPTGGEEPDVWSVKFRPLSTPSEKETAETRKLDMERAAIAIDKSIASADDIATSYYGGDTYSSEISIDWAARKKQQALDEVKTAALDAASLAAMGRQPQTENASDPAATDPTPP